MLINYSWVESYSEAVNTVAVDPEVTLAIFVANNTWYLVTKQSFEPEDFPGKLLPVTDTNTNTNMYLWQGDGPDISLEQVLRNNDNYKLI